MVQNRGEEPAYPVVFVQLHKGRAGQTRKATFRVFVLATRCPRGYSAQPGSECTRHNLDLTPEYMSENPRFCRMYASDNMLSRAPRKAKEVQNLIIGQPLTNNADILVPEVFA